MCVCVCVDSACDAADVGATGMTLDPPLALIRAVSKETGPGNVRMQSVAMHQGAKRQRRGRRMRDRASSAGLKIDHAALM